MNKQALLIVTCALALAGGAAFAGNAPGEPVSGQTVGFTFDVFETIDNTPNGTLTETTPVLTLPQTVLNGTVVLLEDINKPQMDPTNWSDVVFFPLTANAQNGNTLQMFSDTENGIQNDSVIGQVRSSTRLSFLAESSTGTTEYHPGLNTYRFHGDAPEKPAPIPDASTLTLVLAGTCPAIGYYFLRRKQAK